MKTHPIILAFLFTAGSVATSDAATNIFLNYAAGTLVSSSGSSTVSRFTEVTNLQHGDTITLPGAFTGTTNPAYGGQVSVVITFRNTSSIPDLTGSLNHRGNFFVPVINTPTPVSITENSGVGFDIRLDFSGMTNGALPAGSSMYLNDFDAGSRITNLKAEGGTGNFFGPQVNFDANGPATAAGQANPVASDYAVFAFDPISDSYSIIAAATATSDPSSETSLTRNVSAISLNYFAPRGIGNFFQISDTPVIPDPTGVPEPGSTLPLLSLFCLSMAKSRRRRD